MVGWQRLLQPLRSEAGKRFERSAIGLFSSSYHSKAKKLLGEVPSFQNSLISKDSCVTGPLYRYLQQLRFTSSRKLLADSSGLAPISSPLSPALAISSGETENVKAVSKPATVQAILKGIKQSTKKVNLVAALVRGMRVEDALLQLQVTIKRASKAVYQVIHSARANATHNYGFDPDRLLVAEAFVGKGFCQKRVSYHAKGRSGIKIKPECRLTVVLREITEEEEAKIAKLKVNNFRKLSKRERRLVPHKLIETTPVWNRKNRPNNNNNNNNNDDLRRSSDAMAL